MGVGLRLARRKAGREPKEESRSLSPALQRASGEALGFQVVGSAGAQPGAWEGRGARAGDWRQGQPGPQPEERRGSGMHPWAAAYLWVLPSQKPEARAPQHAPFSVVVAIDFGTTSSGYAFSFASDPEAIHMMR